MPHPVTPRRWVPAALACAQLVNAPASAAGAPVRPPTAVSIVIDSRPREPQVVTFEHSVLAAMADLLAPGGARVRVIGAAERVDVLREWQPVDATLAEVADQLPVRQDRQARPVPGEAALADGVAAALDSLASRPEGAAGWIVVLAEGNSRQRHAGLAALQARAAASHVAIVTLLTATHRGQVGRVRQYGFDLFELSRQTGGRFFDLRTSDQALRAAMQRLAGLLR